MRRLLIPAVSAMLSLAGCRETVVEHVPFDLALPSAPDCREPIGDITLTALGDFPTTDFVVAQLDGSGAPLEPITRFPNATLALSASAHGITSGREVYGWAMRSSLGVDATLMLRPLGLSCPLADPEARLPRGAAIAAIDDARVMIVGGLDENDDATQRVAFLHVRSEEVELPRMEDALRLAFASAALVPEGDAVLVTGGAIRAGGDGGQSWERIPFDGSALAFGALRGEARRDHASIAVDGAIHGVLLVGGTDGVRALDSIEWVDANARTGGVLRARLTHARVAPLLVALDADHVAVVGGRDGPGATSASVTAIEVIDLRADSARDLATAITPIALTDLAHAIAGDWLVAIGGAAIAWSDQGHLHVAWLDTDTRARDDETHVALPQVFDPAATALPSGRILLEGHRGDGTRLGFVVDPAADTVTAITTSRVPTSLFTASDGTTLELATAGGSIRRDERGSPFDSPPPTYLFATDQAALGLDLASHWQIEDAALAPAVDGARLAVPVLRMRHFEATLDATGAFDVVLTGEHLEVLATITVTDDAVSAGQCHVPRGASLRIARAIDGSLAGDLGGCDTLDGIDPALRLGLGIVAHTGARLRSLTLVRDLL